MEGAGIKGGGVHFWSLHGPTVFGGMRARPLPRWLLPRDVSSCLGWGLAVAAHLILPAFTTRLMGPCTDMLGGASLTRSKMGLLLY